MATFTITPIKTFVSGENVTPTKLNELSQSNVALTAGTIVEGDIAALAVSAGKLANTLDLTGKAVTLPDGNIATAKIADAAVTAAKLNGAQTGSAPIYGCRAWVNFDGATANNLAGTYARTGTEVTITATAHGLIVDNVVRLDFTAGSPTAAADGTYTVTQVDNANAFRVTTAASGTSSGGTVSILRRLIRGAGNVSSVTYLNAAGDYVINFATAMPNANYAVSVGGSFFGNYVSFATPSTAQAFYMNTYNSTPAASNSEVITCAVFA